ncbi:MAG: Mur ligase family protein, partial [Sutterellaceae bacterium]|nr:Mur ligase family protein [Sutterellaceae bacterium]
MQSLRIPNGHSALVLGAGASGAACAKHLFHRGWKVSVADTRTAPPLGDLATFVGDDFTLALGGMPAELVTQETDLVVMSPGLSPYYSAAAPIVTKAKELGIDVVGEIELFARELKRLKAYRKYAPKVIGITGTNGKTTTTTMVGLMAANGGVSVCVAGNIGPNALAELDKHNEDDTLPDVWVLELSSFQLETTSSLACTAATFLNLTEDHVDWHGSIDAYAAAKAKIFAPATARVVNRDDIVSLREGSDFGRSFGDSDPQAPGQWGVTVENGIEWLSKI